MGGTAISWASLYVCAIFIPCIIWGSISASWYVKYKNIRNMYTPTTCLLLNYTVNSHQCEDCGTDSCTYYTCFDERFVVSYPISNNSYITSIFSSLDNAEKHQQTQV